MVVADTATMSTLPQHIALITETFPPEINGVANTLGRLYQRLAALRRKAPEISFGQWFSHQLFSNTAAIMG
jgi:hypothetical protein